MSCGPAIGVRREGDKETEVVLAVDVYVHPRGVCPAWNRPSGYYPLGYNGDTFTGSVVSADPSADTVTLEYQKGAKTEKLTVIMEGGCRVPSKTGEPMHAKNIREGSVLTAFYMPKTEKINGEKHKLYVFVDISFVEWQGKKIAKENQKVWSCGPDLTKH